MSYIALATDSFDDVAFFYGELLGFPVVAEWDRPNGRGRRYDLGGLRLEILDNSRERQRLELSSPGERMHIVVEVDTIPPRTVPSVVCVLGTGGTGRIVQDRDRKPRSRATQGTNERFIAICPLARRVKVCKYFEYWCVC